MKKLITLFAFAGMCCSLFGAVSRFELLLGLRTGAGAMYSTYKIDVPLSVKTTKEIGVSVPGKAEVLFGIHGFRIGYRFEYMHGIFTKIHDEYSPEIPPLYVNTSPKTEFRRNQFGHFAVLEYAINAGEHFNIVPSFGAGGYTGYVEYKGNSITIHDKTTYSDYYKGHLALSAGLNFEFNWQRMYFILGPNYTYYSLRPKDEKVTPKGSIHNMTLDLAIRLNLLKPRYKNK